MTSKELKKRDAILAIAGVVNIPKYSVKGHESISVSKLLEDNLEWRGMPKGTKTVAVIYLG